jgi:large conductance mechanosensitive channel
VRRFVDEFREFINKGNLLGIAIGFVMGVAFAAVVTAFVESIVMPIIAIPFGEPDFNELWVITVNDSQIRIGTFVTALVTFILIALVAFWLLKAYNRVTKGDATAPPTEVTILGEIRDLLRDQQQQGGGG